MRGRGVKAWVLPLAITWGTPAMAQRVADEGVTVPARSSLARSAVMILSGPSAYRGRGVVLSIDGRIATPFATVHGVHDLRVRYPDGRVEHARVLSVDPGWGVALLEPAATRWPEGAPLESAEASTGQPVAWMPRESNTVETAGTLQRRRTYVGAGDALLRDAWELVPTPAHAAVGSAVVDSAGTVAALIVAPPVGGGADSPPGPFGVPATVLEALRTRALGPEQPWLGLASRDLRPCEESTLTASCGVRVTDVRPDSPAQAAGLHGGERGDVIVGVDGERVRDHADLAALLAQRRSGDRIVIDVLRAGAVVHLSVLLESLTSPTMATDAPVVEAPATPMPPVSESVP